MNFTERFFTGGVEWKVVQWETVDPHRKAITLPGGFHIVVSWSPVEERYTYTIYKPGKFMNERLGSVTGQCWFKDIEQAKYWGLAVLHDYLKVEMKACKRMIKLGNYKFPNKEQAE